MLQSVEYKVHWEFWNGNDVEVVSGYCKVVRQNLTEGTEENHCLVPFCEAKQGESNNWYNIQQISDTVTIKYSRLGLKSLLHMTDAQFRCSFDSVDSWFIQDKLTDVRLKVDNTCSSIRCLYRLDIIYNMNLHAAAGSPLTHIVNTIMNCHSSSFYSLWPQKSNIVSLLCGAFYQRNSHIKLVTLLSLLRKQWQLIRWKWRKVRTAYIRHIFRATNISSFHLN